ncbi:MAG TPA: TetR/AcrR family transcriptional regulator C-terminal domain-containing protein [Streptosporangiaceae bacterium]|nr:TetR/AcrR family transcriptional regulator C-terminal domain-containing protein [Streptosporangiaceae bacterium]
MTSSSAAGNGSRPRERRGRRRGSLSPELIVQESMRLLDAGGADGFSLPKLGRALGADPTAVYRHFASKDDLILAIADHLIDEAMTGISPQPCWVDTLADTARRLRRTYHDHPAAASLSACRTTQRRAEMKTVDIIIGAVLDAGFEGAQAALIYRAFGDFSLAWAGCEADFLALDEQAQQSDRAAWTRAYLAVDPAEHPHIWRVRRELPDVDDDAIFETVLSLVLDGLVGRAPRPCGCHAPVPSP